MTLSEQLLAAIEPVDASLFHLVAAGPNAPSEDGVRALEKEVGFAYPAAFREVLLGELGGLYVRATEESWPPVKEFDIAPAWRFERGVALFGAATDNLVDWLNLSYQLTAARERGTTGFSPVMTVQGSHTVWGYDAEGTLLEDDGEGTVAASDEQNLGALYTREIAALIERQKQVAAG